MPTSRRSLAKPSHEAIYDCGRCDGKGEKLTEQFTVQWQVCFACDGTGCVLPQFRDQWSRTAVARDRAA